VTVTQPIAWAALVLGVVAATWAVVGGAMDSKRIDQLEKVTAGLRGDITEIIRDHRNNLAAVNARIDSVSVPKPDLEAGRFWKDTDPAVGIFADTRPQPIVRGVPTDTASSEAVVEQGVAELAEAMASYGRHAHREVDA
jgi:hypothetical protein